MLYSELREAIKCKILEMINERGKHPDNIERLVGAFAKINARKLPEVPDEDLCKLAAELGVPTVKVQVEMT